MTRVLEPPVWERYPLRTAELCAGYGGLSLSIGDKHPSWVSEVDPHASRVLLDRTREARNGRLEPSNPDSPSHDPRLGEYGDRLRLWEAVTGLPMPDPEEDSPSGGRRLSARFGEWMMGLPRGWVTGIRSFPRTAQIRVLGNGVVPQQGRLAVNTLANRALEVLS